MARTKEPKPRPVLVSMTDDTHRILRIAAAHSNTSMKEFAHEAIRSAALAKLKSVGLDPDAVQEKQG